MDCRCYLCPFTQINQLRKLLLDKVGRLAKLPDCLCDAASFTINQLKLVKVTIREEVGRSINQISELRGARATYRFPRKKLNLLNSRVLFHHLEIDSTYLFKLED